MSGKMTSRGWVCSEKNLMNKLTELNLDLYM
jgi:hypothetical protein